MGCIPRHRVNVRVRVGHPETGSGTGVGVGVVTAGPGPRYLADGAEAAGAAAGAASGGSDGRLDGMRRGKGITKLRPIAMNLMPFVQRGAVVLSLAERVALVVLQEHVRDELHEEAEDSVLGAHPCLRVREERAQRERRVCATSDEQAKASASESESESERKRKRKRARAQAQAKASASASESECKRKRAVGERTNHVRRERASGGEER